MKAIFNNTIIHGNTIELGINDRAFQYGDSLFETALSNNQEVSLLNFHFERIRKGSQLLSYILPEYFDFNFLKAQIRDVCTMNKLTIEAKVKIKIWRKEGGNYMPSDNNINYLISAEPYSPVMAKNPYSADISSSVKNVYNSISIIKSGNALKYVLAGLEKAKRNLNDLVILDQKGNVSEFIQSNIIWIKGDNFYTPSLETGCIAGVMRSYLKVKLNEKGTGLNEGLYSTDDLGAADHVLSCNAMGIIPVSSIGDKAYSEYPEIAGLLP